MSSWLIRLIILACTAVHLLGCAERYRNADAGRTASEVEAFYIENIKGKAATRGDGIPAADLMIEDPSTNIYYAESYVDPAGTVAPMGPVDAVTPVDFEDLDLGISRSQISTIRVYFLDQIGMNGGFNYALVMHITLKDASSQPLIFAVANTENSGLEESSVDDDGVFQVVMPFSNKTLIVESDDTEEGELNDVVQLRLSVVLAGGETISIGQISSMVGFISKN